MQLVRNNRCLRIAEPPKVAREPIKIPNGPESAAYPESVFTAVNWLKTRARKPPAGGAA